MVDSSLLLCQYSLNDFRVSECTVSPKLNRITRAGETVEVEPKIMQVLVCLASRGLEVVNRQELLDEVWAGTFVTDHVLTNAIWQLRKALGSSDLIETIPRRGYRLTVQAVPLPSKSNGSETVPAMAAGPGRLWLVMGIVVLALLLGAIGFQFAKHPGLSVQAPIRTLAWLPFEPTITGESERQLVAGIGQNMRLQLLELHALRVLTARTTPSLYSDGTRKSLRDLAKELSADAIAQGTAAVMGDRVQIHLVLWDERRDKVILSERFERNLKDILTLYGEIAHKIADAGEVPITDIEAARLGGPPLNAEGYREYLMGIGLSGSGRYREQQLEHFKRSIDLNPRFTPAYTAAASLVRTIAVWDPSRREEAKDLAEKAVDLDPKSVPALAILGHIETSLFWNWEEARKRFEEAERLRPAHPALLLPYVEFLTCTRDCEKAAAFVRRQEETDLESAWPLSYTNWVSYMCGSMEAAINAGQGALARDPSIPAMVHHDLSFAYAAVGRAAEAIAECEKAVRNGKCDEPWVLAKAGKKREAQEALDGWVEKWKRGEPVAFYIALGYMGFDDRENAFKWLNRSYEAREADLRLLWDPAFAPLREDARFHALTCKLNLPPGVCKR